MTKKPYQSDLRADQVAMTRARIIEAAAQGFAPWAPDMPFDAVAKRAGVSVRTVYRHFPTQRDLVDAVFAHLIEHSGWDPDKIEADNLGATMARAFEYFGTLLQSGHHKPETPTPELQGLRSRRIAAIERVVGPYTQDMDPELARGICAVFAGLSRVHFLRGMHEHWGLDGAQAGRAVEWAINALFDELRRSQETD